jgi:hypothetical protein
VRLAAAVIVGLAGGAAMVVGFGCVDTEGQTTIACPPIEDFRNVSAVLEQRCGTLDCHGDGARPFKLYGRVGLRAPTLPEAGVDADQYFSGGSEQTTDVELTLNHRALCGLEPEIMSEVTAGARPADDLTIVRKPRLQERHKGGKIWDEGKPGDRCLERWLQNDYEPGGFDPVNCLEELGLAQ